MEQKEVFRTRDEIRKEWGISYDKMRKMIEETLPNKKPRERLSIQEVRILKEKYT